MLSSAVQDPALLERMRRLHAQWPTQRRRDYAAAFSSSSGLVALARPRPYWFFERSVRLAGQGLRLVRRGRGARAFRGRSCSRVSGGGPRRRCSRSSNGGCGGSTAPGWSVASRLGEYVAGGLPTSLFHPGRAALERTHWVFPVVAPDRARLTTSLRRSGFDAATATSSLAALPAPDDRLELTPTTAARIMSAIVFLPLYPELDEAELDEMLAAVARTDGGWLAGPSRGARAAFEELEGEVADLLVIGGGIVGGRVAYEAATAGLRVVLIDKGDFGGATSSASSKLIHGGLRYLATGDLRLVRELQREQAVLRSQVAPHLVRPLSLVLAVERSRSRDLAKLVAALALYAAVSGFRRPRPRLLRYRYACGARPIRPVHDLRLRRRRGGFDP